MKSGFTLTELLLVLALISILMAGGTMVTTSVSQSSMISRDSDMIANELSRASLEAVRMNRPVHFRFYSYTDSLTSHQPLVQAFQTLSIDPETGQYRELGKIRYLSRSVVVHRNPDASTILSMPERKAQRDIDPDLDQIRPYTWYGFEFRPDGSTNLPKDKTWGLVIALHNEGKPFQVPKNYRAIGINPFTGAVKRY
ncbi:MAG: Verru_Chthon cassette protein D [Verrucomicrobiales bacterium]|nr:Verru_Chthon cassette protein D [Verrucomicrobiales bacterium]